MGIESEFDPAPQWPFVRLRPRPLDQHKVSGSKACERGLYASYFIRNYCCDRGRTMASRRCLSIRERKTNKGFS